MPTRRKATPETDPGLDKIDEWHRWFVEAHTTRVRAADMSPDQQARELADIKTLAAAIAERMRENYGRRQQR